MKLEQFNVFKHRNLINSWLRDHKMTPQSIRSFPAVGYVAYESETPLAAGFLRRVEGGYGQIDGLIANPNIAPENRSDAIDLVVEQILIKAKELGLESLVAFTGNKAVLERSVRYGFVPLDQSLIVLNLSADPHSNSSGAV